MSSFVSDPASRLELDEEAWRTATRSAPFVVQLVMGVLFVVMWLLAKSVFPTPGVYEGDRAWLIMAAVITTFLSLGVGAMLRRSPSSRRRGLGVSIAGTSATVLLGSIVFAFVILH